MPWMGLLTLWVELKLFDRLFPPSVASAPTIAPVPVRAQPSPFAVARPAPVSHQRIRT